MWGTNGRSLRRRPGTARALDDRVLEYHRGVARAARIESAGETQLDEGAATSGPPGAGTVPTLWGDAAGSRRWTGRRACVCVPCLAVDGDPIESAGGAWPAEGTATGPGGTPGARCDSQVGWENVPWRPHAHEGGPARPARRAGPRRLGRDRARRSSPPSRPSCRSCWSVPTAGGKSLLLTRIAEALGPLLAPLQREPALATTTWSATRSPTGTGASTGCARRPRSGMREAVLPRRDQPLPPGPPEQAVPDRPRAAGAGDRAPRPAPPLVRHEPGGRRRRRRRRTSAPTRSMPRSPTGSRSSCRCPTGGRSAPTTRSGCCCRTCSRSPTPRGRAFRDVAVAAARDALPGGRAGHDPAPPPSMSATRCGCSTMPGLRCSAAARRHAGDRGSRRSVPPGCSTTAALRSWPCASACPSVRRAARSSEAQGPRRPPEALAASAAPPGDPGARGALIADPLERTVRALALSATSTRAPARASWRTGSRTWRTAHATRSRSTSSSPTWPTGWTGAVVAQLAEAYALVATPQGVHETLHGRGVRGTRRGSR